MIITLLLLFAGFESFGQIENGTYIRDMNEGEMGSILHVFGTGRNRYVLRNRSPTVARGFIGLFRMIAREDGAFSLHQLLLSNSERYFGLIVSPTPFYSPLFTRLMPTAGSGAESVLWLDGGYYQLDTNEYQIQTLTGFGSFRTDAPYKFGEFTLQFRQSNSLGSHESQVLDYGQARYRVRTANIEGIEQSVFLGTPLVPSNPTQLIEEATFPTLMIFPVSLRFGFTARDCVLILDSNLLHRFCVD